MANEISLTVSCTTSLANETAFNFSPGATTITKAAKGIYADRINVGTTDEAMTAFGSLTTPGRCFLRNLDSTNFVELGSANGVYLMQLDPGEPTTFKIASGFTWRWAADTAACEVEVYVLES